METKGPKKDWSNVVGVSESDFHLARSRDPHQHYSSHLERMASIGNKYDPHPMLLGSTYAPTKRLKKY